ncbi:MAG TPA: hypothetical protein VK589_22455 [Chryseolinea sp.]|nr:hypothetical protein [Chryseolinea sp.]
MSVKSDKTSALTKKLWLGLIVLAHGAMAQQISNETALPDAVEYAIHSLPASQLGLYNGPDYTPTTITAGGHPYFSRDDFAPESIVYDGIPYRDIYLLFDAAQQRVIIEDNAGNKICPVERKMESFTVDDHTFKRVSDIEGLPTGFYDVLVDGKELLYARRAKYARGLQWKSSTDYYFFNEGRLFHLTNKKTVVESMTEEEKNVRQYVRQNKLSFNNKIEASLISIVRYYSSLKQR